MLSVDRLYAGVTTIPGSICLDSRLPALIDRAYFMPLGDSSWPDDTLIELEYMEVES